MNADDAASAHRDTAIAISHLSKSFRRYKHPSDIVKELIWGGRRSYGEDFWALRDVSLEAERGEVIGLIGPSGSGKSTILRTLVGLLKPRGGAVTLEGTRIDYGSRASMRAARDRFAIVFQQYNLFQNMTALRNVAIAPTLVKKRDKAQVEAEAKALLARVGLAEKVNAYPDELSGGQQQRVAIARALLQDAQIVLADEPIASLDPRNAARVMDALATINREDGITVLCNLHSLETARAYASRIVGLRRGRVVFDGAPAALTRDAADAIYAGDPA